MNSSSGSSNDRLIKLIFLLIISALLVSFIFWAKNTKLDLLTRGMGRVVAAEENSVVQSSETGTILYLNVRKGDLVEAGDLLASINPTAAQGLLSELDARKKTIEIQLARLDLEISGSTVNELKKLLLKYDDNAAAAQIALFTARETTLQQELASLGADHLSTIESRIEKQKELVGVTELIDILEEERNEILPLVEKGVLGRSEKFRLDREKSRLLAQVEVLNAQLNQIDFLIVSKLGEIELVKNKFFESAFEERAQLMAQLYETTSKIPTLEEDLNATELTSPITGVVNELNINSVGAFVRAGDIIAEIVPSSDDLIIQAFIDPKDIGLIEPGQPCRIALTAFDASRYGYMSGELIRVAPDTIYREDTGNYMFAIDIKFKNKLRDARDQPIAVLPGMVAQVDVVRGERSILEYIWQPVAKIKDDAFRQ